MKINIKTRIFLLLVFILLLPFLILKWHEFYSIKQKIESKQVTILSLKNRQVKKIFDKYREEVNTYARVIAQMQELQEPVSLLADETGWSPEDELNPYNYPHESYIQLSTGMYDPRFENLRNVSRKVFNTLNNKNPYVGNLEVMNKNLVVIMRGHRDKRGDLKSDQLIKDAVKGVSSAGFLVSKRTGQPAIDGTAPIYYSGQIVGGVKVGMYITAMVGKDIEEQAGVELTFFDEDMLVKNAGFTESTALAQEKTDFRQFDVLSFNKTDNGEVNIKIQKTVYDSYILLNKPYQKLYSKTENGSFALSIIPIANYDEKIIGAYMVAMNNDQILAEIDAELKEVIKTGILILVLIIVISYYLSHQIGDPISNFKDQLHKMKREDNLKPLENINGPQELMDMAFEFNSLIDAFTYQKKLNQELEEFSNLDGLTNLLNHRKFYNDLKLKIQKNKEFSLLFFDLDKFKLLNDTLGHSVGDAVLREVASILKQFDEDERITSYRYGGEEFAVILSRTNKTKTYEIAEKLRTTIENAKKLENISGKLKVTISIGIAEYPKDAKTEHELVQNADYAMYSSKKNGRNRTTLYTEQIMETFVEKSGLSVDEQTILDTVNSIFCHIESKEDYTKNQSRAVMIYSMILGYKLNLDHSEIDRLKYAALLHNSGTIGVTEALLNKKRVLSKTEYDEIKNHSLIGHNIVNNITSDSKIKKAILHHHENWDGTGYPDGLKGEDIPLFSRIISIAGSYQAMLSRRPYRSVFPKEQAIRELNDQKQKKYDPQLVDLFVDALEDSQLCKNILNKNI
ncbi:MAG: diguanylate cyclase [Desulfamplus sp.]|nr:diguanylate cyclase [Desulfamplus sp.]